MGGIGTKFARTNVCILYVHVIWFWIYLYSIDKQLAAFFKKRIEPLTIEVNSHKYAVRTCYINVDVANEEFIPGKFTTPTQRHGWTWFWNVDAFFLETWAYFFLSTPRRLNEVTCQTLILWWSKRLKETSEQTWMSGVFSSGKHPQKNWDAFCWPWLFGHPAESSNVRVARCGKRYCPFNRKGVRLGRMGWKTFWGWWSVDIHTKVHWFQVFSRCVWPMKFTKMWELAEFFF